MATQKPTAPRFNPQRVMLGAFIPNAVLELPADRLSANAKICYARLLRFAGKRGVAYPRVDTLAAEVGLNRRAVFRALDELRAIELVSTTKRGPGKPALFHFHLPEWIFGPVEPTHKVTPVSLQSRQEVTPVSLQKPAATKDRARGLEDSHKQKLVTAARGGSPAARGPVFTQQGNPGAQRRVLALLSGIVNKH